MKFFWRKNRENIEAPNTSIIPESARYEKFLNTVLREKCLHIQKVIDVGCFGATVIVKENVTGEDVKVRILKEGYVGEKEREWNKLNHRNLVPVLKIEYLKPLGTYLFYSPVEETTLHEKIEDTQFKKDSDALWKILNMLEKIADGVTYINSLGLAHLNLQATSMIVSKDDVVQISDFHYLSSTNIRTEK